MPTLSAPLEPATHGLVDVGQPVSALRDLVNSAEVLARARLQLFTPLEGEAEAGVCLECHRASRYVQEIPHTPSCVVGRVLGGIRVLRAEVIW